VDLTPYVDALESDLAAAAAAGSEETQATAILLAGALDASLRLCLLDALSAMAAEVTAAGDLGTVEIRMHGRDPEVVVIPTVEPDRTTAAPPPTFEDEGGDTARITLRLPEALKVLAEEAAGIQNISVNAWLVKAVSAALRSYGDSQQVARPPSSGGRSGRTISGFARS
jgi:hypothetical protein